MFHGEVHQDHRKQVEIVCALVRCFSDNRFVRVCVSLAIVKCLNIAPSIFVGVRVSFNWGAVITAIRTPDGKLSI